MQRRLGCPYGGAAEGTGAAEAWASEGVEAAEPGGARLGRTLVEADTEADTEEVKEEESLLILSTGRITKLLCSGHRRGLGRPDLY